MKALLFRWPASQVNCLHTKTGLGRGSLRR